MNGLFLRVACHGIGHLLLRLRVDRPPIAKQKQVLRLAVCLAGRAQIEAAGEQSGGAEAEGLEKLPTGCLGMDSHGEMGRSGFVHEPANQGKVFRRMLARARPLGRRLRCPFSCTGGFCSASGSVGFGRLGRYSKRAPA